MNDKWGSFANNDSKDPTSRTRLEEGISIWDVIIMGFWVLIIAGALSLLFGCKSVERLETRDERREVRDTLVVYKHDSVVQTKVFVDSVYVRDSSWMNIKGDTIYVWKERVKSVLREKVDTLRLVKTDTVYNTRIETSEVRGESIETRGESWWNKLKWCIIGVMMSITVGGVIALIRMLKE